MALYGFKGDGDNNDRSNMSVSTYPLEMIQAQTTSVSMSPNSRLPVLTSWRSADSCGELRRIPAESLGLPIYA